MTTKGVILFRSLAPCKPASVKSRTQDFFGFAIIAPAGSQHPSDNSTHRHSLVMTGALVSGSRLVVGIIHQLACCPHSVPFMVAYRRHSARSITGQEQALFRRRWIGTLTKEDASQNRRAYAHGNPRVAVSGPSSSEGSSTSDVHLVSIWFRISGLPLGTCRRKVIAQGGSGWI